MYLPAASIVPAFEITPLFIQFVIGTLAFPTTPPTNRCSDAVQSSVIVTDPLLVPVTEPAPMYPTIPPIAVGLPFAEQPLFETFPVFTPSAISASFSPEIPPTNTNPAELPVFITLPELRQLVSVALPLLNPTIPPRSMYLPFLVTVPAFEITPVFVLFATGAREFPTIPPASRFSFGVQFSEIVTSPLLVPVTVSDIWLPTTPPK